jgi:sugar lactone lactonase YvrE
MAIGSNVIKVSHVMQNNRGVLMNPIHAERQIPRGVRLWAAHVMVALTACATPWTGVAQAATSSGLPWCDGVEASQTMLSGQGPLESIAFDQQGRMLFTNMLQSALVRMSAPSAMPVVIAKGLSSPGGIVVADAETAYVGTGNSLNGLIPQLSKAGIAKVNMLTGQVTSVVAGLSMANGVVRASDGTFYASDDLAASLDRVLPDGKVERTWLKQNSNGLAISPDQQTLYVNQMIPARVLAVNRSTGLSTVVAEAPAARKWSWLDGLDIDDQGHLYVVSYWGGEVWRLSPTDGRMCLLVEGLLMPSAVAVGRSGQGFDQASVYVTKHSGRVHRVPKAVPH